MPEELEWKTRKERVDRKLKSLHPAWSIVKYRSGIGSGVKHLRVGDVEALNVPVPSLEEQHEIVRRVEALFKVADDIEKRYEKAKAHVDKLTQSILSKAFRGELVPQDPNDEPASEMLKRIQAERRQQEAEGRPGRKG